jgi:hypothetical protein
MKPPKPLRKVSKSRERMLNSETGKVFLKFNSTIRRESCNAITAARKYVDSRALESLGLRKGTVSISANPSWRIADSNFKGNFGKQRKPVKKQSEKQKSRLQYLACVRRNWWKDSMASNKPLICGICDEEIRYFEDLASDHIEPGTAKKDSLDNLQPAHIRCNVIKGSIRNFKIVRGDHNWLLIHGML